jgi:L-fuconolactonase
MNQFKKNGYNMNTPFIDAHQHFWHYAPTKHSWMSDSMSILKNDYLPPDLVPLLGNCGLNGCIAIQANQAEEENTFLLNLAEKHDSIKGIVGWVDLQSDNIEARLAYYQKFSLIKGFRHVIHDEANIDFMLCPAFLKGISLLKKYGYTYDILIFPEHLPNTLKLVAAFPNQPFVIDHIAKPLIKEGTVEPWQKSLKAVAQYKNVSCKISGMVTEANWKNWKQADFTPYMDTIIELFGIDRIMYGSDWPVCTLSATYEAQFRIVKDYFSTFTKTEQAHFFGGNAVRFYNLGTM